MPKTQTTDSLLANLLPKKSGGNSTTSEGGGPRLFPNSAAWREKWLGLDESNQEVCEMCRRVEQWAKRCMFNDPNGPKVLILAGRYGVGKTRCLTGAYRYCSALAVTMWDNQRWPLPPDSVLREWQTLASVERISESRIWEDAVSAKLLFLDDVGSETDVYKSGLPTENLRSMLGARERKWTMLTTNVPPENWTERWDGRVEDRLHRNTEIFTVVNAPSWWRQKESR